MNRRVFGFLLVLLTICPVVSAQSAPASGPASPRPAGSAEYVGEAFGNPVTKSEFDFAFKTASLFSVTEQQAETDAQRRSETWKHIVFLREAKIRKIEVPRAELESEMKRLLVEKNVEYGSYGYFKWVKTEFGEDHKTLESRVENLLRIKKMLDGIMNPPPPVITDEQAKQKFLNQYNSMNVEFVNFPTLEEAKKFQKSTTPKKWDEAKAKDAKFSTPTGHISLEAVIDLWQVPTADAYRIHAMKPGEIGAPAKMYKGYGVFRLTDKKNADASQYDNKKRDEYKKVLEQVYYYEKTQKVLREIVDRAAFKDYERDKIVVVETSQGSFEVQLYNEVAPKASENFMRLAEKGYYDGLTFHRVMKGFMIQGGDPNGDGSGGKSIWGDMFEDEMRPEVQFEKAGILAMANSGPNTNASQFFVTLSPQPGLNMKHTIFGEVIKGFETVRAIGGVAVDPESNRPVEKQVIQKVRLKQWKRSA